MRKQLKIVKITPTSYCRHKQDATQVLLCAIHSYRCCYYNYYNFYRYYHSSFCSYSHCD